MKKSFTILMALVITFFTVPFGGLTASAEEKAYDIEDGKYELGIRLLKEGTDETSAAADFMNETATLTIENGKIELTFYIPNNPMMNFNKFEVEGLKPTEKEVDGLNHYTFNLSELTTSLSAIVSYEVPMIIKHDDVGMDVELLGLNELPEKEEPTEAPDEREVGKLLTEDDADAVYELEYETESKATSAQLLNPVKLLEKDDKQYIQIPINERGADYFRSLKINDKQVIWDSITEGPYTIQFELPGKIEDTLLMDMVIQAGPNVMPHSGIEINFNIDTIETIKEPEVPEEPEEQPEVIEVADGDYTIEYEALHATEDKASGMARYLENQASLSVSNGKTLLTLTINDHKTVTGFQVEKDGTLIEPKNVTVNDKENSREVIYELDELLSTVKAQVQYTVGAHNGDQPLRLAFNEDSLEKIESEDPEDENTPESELDPKDLAEGVYTLDYAFLKKGEDQASSMDNFTDGPAFVKVDKDGNLFVALTLTSAEMIQWFKVNGQEVTILQENEESQTRIVEFAVDNLTKKQTGNVFVEVPGMYSTEHEVDLLFNTDSLERAEDSEYPEKEKIEQQPEPEEPVEKPDEKPIKPEQPTTPTKKSELTPDKAYEIGYVVKQENGTSVSISNDFFEKPAILLEKDGIKYIQVTITNGDLVKDLSNKYGEALLVKTKEDGSIVVQLRINEDLADMLIDMHIIVPSGFFPGFPGYDEQHKAILVFDKDNVKEIDADKYLLVSGSQKNTNGPFIKDGEPGETIGEEGPEKPEFGNGNDHGDDEGNGDNGDNEDTVTPSKNNNPQTGDTTSILLYSMLFIGSLIPLAIKLRRRFV